MYSIKSPQSDPYNDQLSLQADLIQRAATHVVENMHGGDDVVYLKTYLQICDDPSQHVAEYEAYACLKKHWRLLRKADPSIVLPKKYLPHFSLEKTDGGGIVENLSKGSKYELTWVDEEELACECIAYNHGATCSHSQYAFDRLLNPFKGIEKATQPEKEALPESNVVEFSDYQEILPGIVPTSEQAVALHELENFALDAKQIHLLSGFAGTGKTVLLQAMIKRLKEKGYNLNIVFTAPTNKATQVLRRMVRKWKLGVTCATCAKTLNLRRHIDDKTGQQRFTPTYDKGIKTDIDILVIDEASMVGGSQIDPFATPAENHEGLWNYLNEYAQLTNTKLLFTGDYAQLPPVNEGISRVFFDIPKPSRLTEVKRFGGAINQLATEIRTSLGKRGEFFFVDNHSEDCLEGVFLQDRQRWYETIVKAFRSDAYINDPDHCRVLAYTNVAVKKHNEFIREAMNPGEKPRFIEGERLLMKDHFKYGDASFYSSDELQVSEAYEGTLGGWSVWWLTVDDLGSESIRRVIPVLHESESARFTKELSGIKKLIKKGGLKQEELKYLQKEQRSLLDKKQSLMWGAESDERLFKIEEELSDLGTKIEELRKVTATWQDFWNLKERFANVDYAYAMTIHKSQGSTFTNCFLDVPNIMLCKSSVRSVEFPHGKERISERNQLLYVAATRAAKRLFVYE